MREFMGIRGRIQTDPPPSPEIFFLIHLENLPEISLLSPWQTHLSLESPLLWNLLFLINALHIELHVNIRS